VVNKNGVRLFWDSKTDDPAYKLTTDWGAVDGYHAPGRNPGSVFPSAKPAAWTLDAVESPRNSGWFLCALAARRALTFLEQQPDIDPNRLGVYGHSTGIIHRDLKPSNILVTLARAQLHLAIGRATRPPPL
jgi:hypothetical protein